MKAIIPFAVECKRKKQEGQRITKKGFAASVTLLDTC